MTTEAEKIELEHKWFSYRELYSMLRFMETEDCITQMTHDWAIKMLEALKPPAMDSCFMKEIKKNGKH